MATVSLVSHSGSNAERKGADSSTGAARAVLTGIQKTKTQKNAEHDAWLAGIQRRKAPEKQNRGLRLPPPSHEPPL